MVDSNKGSNRTRGFEFERGLGFERVLGFERALGFEKGSATARSRRRNRCGEAAWAEAPPAFQPWPTTTKTNTRTNTNTGSMNTNDTQSDVHECSANFKRPFTF